MSQVFKDATYYREQLRDIHTFMLDLDGTFYLGDQLYPWSIPFIQKLKRLGKQFIFVTNNSSRSARYYTAKILRMGLEIETNQVFTSGEATIHFLQKNNIPQRVYLLGTHDLEEEFISRGYQLTSHHPAAVVLGFDLTLTYEKLQTACTLIRSGVPFIATHPDFNCPTPTGPIPDCGAMTAFITAATGVNPKVIGKPHPEMVEALCTRFNLERQHVAMVGDRLYTDIAMGQAAGIKSILVLSGETQREDLENSPFQPDLVAAHLGEIADWLS